jgi:hypothetical protein
MGVLSLAGRTEKELEKGPSEAQQRLDVFIPGATIAVVGFVLILFAKRSSVVTATTPDQWFSISVTQEAADLAKATIAQRGYPSGAGLRVAEGPSNSSLVVQFDLPPDSERDCVAEDQGVSVFTEKHLLSRVAGNRIAVEEDKLILVESPTTE